MFKYKLFKYKIWIHQFVAPYPGMGVDQISAFMCVGVGQQYFDYYYIYILLEIVYEQYEHMIYSSIQKCKPK